MNQSIFAILMVPLLCSSAASSAEKPVWLSSLDLSKVQQGWGKAQADKSVQEKTITIAGQKFEHGVGTHAISLMYVNLNGKAERFTAWVGMDDEIAGQPGSVEFKVIGDGKTLWDSGRMTANQTAAKVAVDVRGVKTLLLFVDDGEDGASFDHADWADAQITMTDGTPETMAAPVEKAVILTPKPGPAPRLNGPKVYGCRPGHPFLYRIPCTGERPLQFTANPLPASLKLDVQTGIITGTVPAKGEYQVTLQAMNSHGRNERMFKIVAGDTLSLTPQMGFNDWYAYTGNVTDADMRLAADVMISSGMADAGYQYVNVDGCWQGKRDAAGNLLGNARFPDMKALADYIHRKGLKAGLYTSPGPTDCAGFTGAYLHEAQDAKQFAEWGFDFLKYDWCSYEGVAGQQPTLDAMMNPYQLMGDLLKQQNRDIVFNLCQYGMGDVWKWGKDVGGQSWRTGSDLNGDLDRLFDIALKNVALGAYNGPGGWNDPDYLQLGRTSRGMTPTEQYSFMSLWCLLAAPLFYSGDMAQFDEFTLNILCNPEVIEVDQDPLGQCAHRVGSGQPGKTFVLVKDMEDGSKAVGLCNRSGLEASCHRQLVRHRSDRQEKGARFVAAERLGRVRR